MIWNNLVVSSCLTALEVRGVKQNEELRLGCPRQAACSLMQNFLVLATPGCHPFGIENSEWSV